MLSNFQDAVETAILALPAAALLIAATYALHRRRQGPQAARSRVLRDACLVMALVGIGVFTLLPGPRSGPLAVELIPLRGIVLNAQGDFGYALTAMAANVLLFAPAGFALYWVLGSVGRSVMIGAAIAAGVEFLQWALVGGRVVATDDALLNTVGALGGALGAAFVFQRMAQDPRRQGLDRRQSLGS